MNLNISDVKRAIQFNVFVQCTLSLCDTQHVYNMLSIKKLQIKFQNKLVILKRRKIMQQNLMLYDKICLVMWDSLKQSSIVAFSRTIRKSGYRIKILCIFQLDSTEIFFKTLRSSAKDFGGANDSFSNYLFSIYCKIDTNIYTYFKNIHFGAVGSNLIAFGLLDS